MASDSDGSAAILRSIRDKLAEYKGLVLRQLEEQRDALLAEGEDEEEEEEEEDADAPARADSTKGHKDDAGTEDEGDVAMTDDSGDAGLDKPADTTKVSPVTKKRKHLEPAAGGADDAVAKKQRQSMERQSEGAVATGGNERCVEAPTDGSSPTHSEAPSPVNYRVSRTSTPSKKYLDGSMQQAREFSGVAGARPVLLSKPAANGGISGSSGKRVSVVHPHIAFERQLRESVRIDREVGRRSLAMTRKRQLPRLPVPSRREAHWDLLLQEMKWMATDFSQERNWKRVMQFHLAKDVIVAQNAERLRQEKQGRQIAREVSLQVSAFWRTVERIAARSRVRFEESGVSDASKQGDPSFVEDTSISAAATLSTEPAATTTTTTTIETIDSPSKNKLTANGGDVKGGAAVDGADSLVMRFKKIDVARNQSQEAENATLERARDRLRFVLGSGKRARDAMSTPLSDDDERLSVKALRDFHGQHTSAVPHRPATMLAAFQLLAIRWMVELYSSGLNMLLNDQLGMGKAATIVAFLRVVELVVAHQDPVSKLSTGGPHLVVVSDQELHKWRHYLRLWHPDKYIQLYDTSVCSPGDRRRLRQEWRRKPKDLKATNGGQFMEDSDRRDEEWEDDETSNATVFCVLCPVRAFAKDAAEFTAFSEWQMLIVENEHDEQFASSEVLLAMRKIRQQQRRVLCNAHPFETWPAGADWGEFLLEDGAAGDDGDQVRWFNAVAVDKPSATQTLHKVFGHATSARVSSWKSSDDDGASVAPTWLALMCLSLRRVRSEVESQLGKVEELSVSCATLTASQTVQYRNAIAGFAAALSSSREERLEEWLRLLLRLRMICNCVDLVNDLEKLGQADLGLLTSSSTKLDALTPLLSRLVRTEGKKVVIYSQSDAMFPILEVYLSLLDMSYVRITGSVRDQRRALCHFADRRAVSVALASTRLSAGDEHHAACVFGAEAIVVLDSDWSSTCDAKLRASWAKMVIAAETLPVYRMHCENTIEESLLRAGASLSEKLFGELTPQELLAAPPDLLLGSGSSRLALEKPSWWSSRASASASASSIMANLARDALAAERAEGYCGDAAELARQLVVYNVELDAEEHLLLASTDELTPVEWYAVNYVHGITDKKRTGASRSDSDVAVGSSANGKDEAVDDDDGGWREGALYEPSFRSFEELATAEANQWWQSGDASKALFFTLDEDDSAPLVADGGANESLVEKLMAQLRREGSETHYNVYAPPHPDVDNALATPKTATSEPGTVDANQMLFRVSYREPAPPMPPPTLPPSQPMRHKSDAAHADGPPSAQKLSKKKQRANAAAAGMKGSGAVTTGGQMTGVKRKLDHSASGSLLGTKGLAAGGSSSSNQSSAGSGAASNVKEQRVDLDGIPLPELEDDDFWGDTNLDALDSASWDDASVLSGILGPPGMDLSTDGGSAGSGGGINVGGGAGGLSAFGAGGVGGASGAGEAQGRGGAATSTTKSGSKKSKAAGATGGRARKGSVSGDSSASASSWSASDDLVLKKLFELYGSNWSLIAHVFNTSTSVSRYYIRKRTPRQCYDRYGKIISGSLAPSSSSMNAGGSASTGGASSSKDGKASAGALSAKQQKAAAAAAALWTPAVLDERIGLPPSELLVAFPLRHSLPGLPPPSIVNAPSLVEMSLKKKLLKQQLQATPGKSAPASHDDLKSIKCSFDAIIQCMKRKTAPPSVPAPASGMAALSSSTVSSETAAADSAKHATPSSFSPSIAASTSKALRAMTASIASTASAVPHKSHVDMVSLLPTVVLGPDEVIKRSKEAAVVAVQAAAAVASVGGGAAGGDGMMMAGSPSGFSGGGLLSRRSHAASLTASTTNNAGIAASGTAAATPTRLSATSMGMAPSHALPPTVPVPAKPLTTSSSASWGGQSEMAAGIRPSGSAVVRNGGMMTGDGSMVMASAPVGMGMGVVVSPSMTHGGVGVGGAGNAAGLRAMAAPQPAPQPMPVTTSTLLHVLDRMPEIKNKIQSILNRTDCSEAQKVAMIARLLSNSNAITSATAGSAGAVPSSTASSPSSIQVMQPTAALLGAPMAPATAAALHHPHHAHMHASVLGAAAAAVPDSDDVLSSLTSDPSIMNASMLLEPTEAPLPLPASLASPPASPGPAGPPGFPPPSPA